METNQLCGRVSGAAPSVVIYAFCVARYHTALGPVPVRSLWVGDHCTIALEVGTERNKHITQVFKQYIASLSRFWYLDKPES